MAFSSTINIATMTANQGFRIDGDSADDHTGVSVSSAGDVNGDGIADLLFGADWDGDGGSLSGAAYVLFGSKAGFGTTFDLATIDGINGAKFTGVTQNVSAGQTVSGLGDVNGDGIGDFLIGAPFQDSNGNGAGSSYVVFGQTGTWASDTTLGSMNGTNGFQIIGEDAYDFSGSAISAAGDVNGDGINDILIGASWSEQVTTSHSKTGTAYVVLGTDTGFATNFYLSSLDGSNGFALIGDINGRGIGTDVTNAGDINGDGVDDILVGASGSTLPPADAGGYVVFGDDTNPFAAATNVSALDGTNGFRITTRGPQVAGGGDINGDGYDDLIVADQGQGTYVIFGKASGFSADLDPTALTGADGFRVNTPKNNGVADVAIVGDVNGDGFADFAISSEKPNVFQGAAFIVFGKAGGWNATFKVSNLNGDNGFRVDGDFGGDIAFFGENVSAAGDINGDHLSDIVFGARTNSTNSLRENGSAFVMLGQGPDGAVTRKGSAADQQIVGGNGGDTLFGYAGNDTLIGNGGRDSLLGGNQKDKLYGGVGFDTLNGQAGNDKLFGEKGSDTLLGGGGRDMLNGGGFNDRLGGGGGKDTLLGGMGNDTLDGGYQGDILRGGQGQDVFVFSKGKDRIKDFQNDKDTIHLDGDALGLAGQSVGDILATATTAFGNTKIVFGATDILIIEHFTTISDLADDLIII